MKTVIPTILFVFVFQLLSYSQQYTLTVIPLKEIYLVGEPIQVFISVRNIGTKDSEGCFYGQMKLKLINEKGEIIGYNGPSGDSFSPCGIQLEPNEEVCSLIEVNMYFGKVFNLAYYDHYLDADKYTLEVIFLPNINEQIISSAEIIVGEPIGEEKIVYDSFWDITEGEVNGKYTAFEIVQMLQKLHETYPNSVYSTIILTQLESVYFISLKDGEKTLLIRKELVEKYPSLRAWWMLGGTLLRMKSDLERAEYLTQINSKVKDTLIQKFYEQKIKELKKSLVEIADTNYRSGYFLLSVGIADLLGIGFGYQINRNYAIGIKWGGYWISGKGRNEGAPFLPDGGGGFALRLSRTLDFKLLNNINSEIMLFSRVTANHSLKPLIKGAALDINIGHENKIENGFNIFWSIGFVISSAKGVPPLYLPNIKIGINLNFN